MSEHLRRPATMDPYIRIGARPGGDRPRDLPRASRTSSTPTRWHPIRVICETCGRVGTTIVTKWDGERVFYECRAEPRDLGDGLRLAPAGSRRSAARAKLPWNLEWAAQWSLFGVTIEPCGKDLATAGGSRDRSDAIAREVFEREPPINVPYEFLNIGGKKMSTSKGRGAAAHQIVEVVPPEQLRFLFLRPRPNQAIEFDPDGHRRDPAPVRRVRPARRGRRRAARSRASCRRASRRSSATRCSTRTPTSTPRPPRSGRPSPTSRCSSRSRASTSGARWRRRRGARSTTREQAILDERARGRAGLARRLRARSGRGSRVQRRRCRRGCGRARRRRSAPSSARSPSDAAAGDGRATATPGRPRSSRPRRARGLPAGRAFAALYLAFLGRPNGPRAGWLLAEPRSRRSSSSGCARPRRRAPTRLPA